LIPNVFHCLLLTGNGFAKAGLRKTKLSVRNRTEQKPFSFAKIQKFVKENGFLRINLTKSSPQGNFTPAFAKPMLAEVFYFSSISSIL
jgi:hypothetical protein